MIDAILRLFRRQEPDVPDPPDISEFVAKQRASRAHAISQRRASEQVTRELQRESRDFSDTLAVPPFWHREGGRDA